VQAVVDDSPIVVDDSSADSPTVVDDSSDDSPTVVDDSSDDWPMVIGISVVSIVDVWTLDVGNPRLVVGTPVEIIVDVIVDVG
jgi:hypothetical protein